MSQGILWCNLEQMFPWDYSLWCRLFEGMPTVGSLYALFLLGEIVSQFVVFCDCEDEMCFKEM